MAGPSFSSSKSSFSYGWTYDVFLSFRGQDTRLGFTGNLYDALRRKGIVTFIDDEELQRGEQITPSLLKAIEESRIAITVLSKNYASSSFCLDELAYILHCINGKGRLVLPVFYDVDPSDVRHQRGSYGEALARHEERFKDDKGKVQKWRMALHQAANLSGWHFEHGNEYDYEFIGRIVEVVSSKINCAPLHVAGYPVGLESRVLKVNSLLDVGSDDGVHMVGIYGIGGIGKTTIARAVYNFIADQFDVLCFLDNVRESSIKRGLVHLQEKLLSKIVGEKNVKLGSVNEGIPIIKHRLHRTKVLLILDDVDKVEQLRAIVGGPDWFGSGSRVIITTRDKHLLACHGVKRTYEVDELNEKEALELLSWNAFKNDIVDPSYVDILNQAVAYASGLPLALEVIGSNLFEKSIEEWRSALASYERIPNKEIQKILKVSFDSLEDYQQEIFLDIACCFKGYTLKGAEDILRAHQGACVKYAIGVLIEKSLIKIEVHCVTLHDLIEDMGKEIVRPESPKEPGKRSRLWFPKEIVQVLEDNTGTSKIQIIITEFINEEDEVEWDGKAFKKMKNLKTLIIREGRGRFSQGRFSQGRFSQGPKHLPNSLRVLEWWGYPSKYFPSDFHPKKLAIFNIYRSCLMSLELLEKRKKFVNLSVLEFNECEYMTRIPDVSGVPNLEHLSFWGCENLIKIHESVGFLEKLRILDGSGCSKLRSFPPIIKLTSLEQLALALCGSLESFPEILGKMEKTTVLDLEGTPIKELPFSIRNLTRLRKLGLSEFGMLQLPSSMVMFPELEEVTFLGSQQLGFPELDVGEEKVSSMVSSNAEAVRFRFCNLSNEFLSKVLACFANVKKLDLYHSKFTILPASIKECRFLRELKLNDCKNLKEIRGIPPSIEKLIARNCTSLTSLARSMLLNEELHEEGGNKMFHLPGTTIPEWFEHDSWGPSISFWFRSKLPAISLSVVFGLQDDPFTRYTQPVRPKLIINGNEDLLDKNWYAWASLVADHIIIFDLKQIKFERNVDEVLLEDEWNHVLCTLDWPADGLVIRQWGIHVFKQRSSMEDVQFTNPMMLKYEHGLVDMRDSWRQFMPQQKNLASLALLEPPLGQGRELLSLLSPPALKSLSDNVAWESNSMVSPQISSTTSVQGCQIASRKRKIGPGLDLDYEASEPFGKAPSKVALDSDSIMSSSARDTASEGDCGTAPRKRKIDTLRLDLDNEASELFCHAPSKVVLDSDSIVSSLATDGGLQEQQHLTSIIQQNFEGCESVNEVEGKEMVECNSNDGEDNGRGPLMELLPMTKENQETSGKYQPASNDKTMAWDPMELEYQVTYPGDQFVSNDESIMSDKAVM